MPQSYQPLRTVRVIASHANVNKEHRTVNVTTTAPANRIPTRLQAAGVSDRTVETVIYSGGANVAGLPAIFISGFTAPA